MTRIKQRRKGRNSRNINKDINLNKKNSKNSQLEKRKIKGG